MNERETLSNKPMNRRGAFKLVAGAGLAAAGAGAPLTSHSTMAAGGPLEVTSDVNLYVDTDLAEVVRVLETGEQVTHFDVMNPELVDGHRHVTTSLGESGWVNDIYLHPVGTPPEETIFATPRWVTVNENMLAQPNGDVVANLEFGTQVEVSTLVEGEFIYGRVWLESGIVVGWVRTWILAPESARPFTVTLPELEGWVPMMAEANDDATVVAEVPVGAKVIDYDGIESNGYLGVESALGSGWIRKEFLGVG